VTGPEPIRLEAVRHQYGETVALAGIDLTVRQGECIALIGPNGAGKTTLLSIISGVVYATSGQVNVLGHRMPRERRLVQPFVGYSRQDPALYPVLTVRENLDFFGRLHGFSARQSSRVQTNLIQALDLGTVLNRRAAVLSGGERRRVNLAISLMGQPRLILMDEATAGADVTSRTRILELTAELAAEGRTVVYSTHYLEELRHFPDRVVVIVRGTKALDGSLYDFEKAASVATVEFTYRDDSEREWQLAISGDSAADVISQQVQSGTQDGRLVNIRLVDSTLDAAYTELVRG
jgi:ABC-2 type transport system ATP-binding protein